MTKQEDQEYTLLAQKRETRKLTNKEHKRYCVLVDKAIRAALPKLAKTWMNGLEV